MFMRRGRTALSTRRALAILPIWLTASIWLWRWWFDARNHAHLFLYLPLTFAVFYEYVVMPTALLYSIFSAREPKKRKTLHGKKVAVITLCVPSQESLGVIERQLKAISNISYEHDSWILDEGGNPKIKKLARKYGVKYFSRKGVAKYNLADYPYKAKTKAGNVNAWLDKVRKLEYDFFVQMDIDHLPTTDYLDKTLGHFRDKKIAWVQAPSVYGNLQGWTSRGSAEQELGFHGPLQMGLYSNTQAPVIVGSHTTFRMKAINEIGGFQPTRAEDHLNTLTLMNKGYNGVYLPDVIAVGDGPETFSAYLSQQYAWAFSMTQILKTYSWNNLKNLSTKRKLHYLFLETWYPLWSLSYFILFAVPVVGLMFNTYAIDSVSSDFVYRFLPAFIASLLVVWASMPLSQPQGLSLSWRGMLLHVIRWPVILMAVLSAFMGRVKPYQVTPKGRFLKDVPTVKLYRPFLFLSLAGSFSILYSIMKYKADTADGLLIFAGTNLITMLSICVVDLCLRLKKVKLKPGVFMQHWLKPTAAVLSAVLFSTIILSSAVSINNQTILALGSKRAATSARDVSIMAPRLLTDEELARELSSDRYNRQGVSIPKVGMYSPSNTPTNTMPYIKHGFYDWREDRRLGEELLNTIREGNTPFLTIEPKGETDGAKLLRDIGSGQHDQTINKDLKWIGDTRNEVYVRFGHEMDLADLYPWGNRDPRLYIDAYRHVTQLAKDAGITNIKWVWGPGGVPGAAAYYPGDDVVDVIGTTVLYDKYWTGNQQYSFYDLVSGRIWLQQYNKPVWVTEFGAGNFDKEYQARLIKDAVDNYQTYGFSALIYINLTDSNINGPDYSFEHVADLTSLLGLNKTKIAPLTTAPKPEQSDSLLNTKQSARELIPSLLPAIH